MGQLVTLPANVCQLGRRILIDSQDRAEVISICQQFDVKVSSGYRSAGSNLASGGASNSDHLRGQAVDLVGSPSAMNTLYQWSQGRFPYVEPWSLSKNHVHISFQHQGSSVTAGSVGGGSVPSGTTPGGTLTGITSGLNSSLAQQLSQAGCSTMVVLFGFLLAGLFLGLDLIVNSL